MIRTISKKAACLVNNKYIEAHLQCIEKFSHGVTSKIELKKWTSHSMRVVACVLLSEVGHDIPFFNGSQKHSFSICKTLSYHLLSKILG